MPLPLAHSLQDPKAGEGVEGLVGSSDRDLGREARVGGALPAQPLPTAHPSPVPASRGQGPGLRQDLRCHRPGRDPGAQLLQGGSRPAPLSLQSLEGRAAALAREGGLCCISTSGIPSSPAPASPLSLQPVNNADFIIPVEIDGVVHQVRVRGRWGSWCLHYTRGTSHQS